MIYTLKVAVLMGGPSEEHPISLKSGTGVAEALRRYGWIAEPVVIPKGGSIDEARAFARQALEQLGPDVVFIALHGWFGEDGTIQQLCEDLHLAYTGSEAQASRLGMDKVASRKQCEEVGLTVPRWELLDASRACAVSAPTRLSLPLVVKPRGQGSSIGVSVVRQAHEFARAVELAAHYGSEVLVEECVAGRELTVGILGDEPLPIIEICPKQSFFDFTAKYTPGATEYIVPAVLAPEVAAAVQAAARTAHRALGCRHLSRTDLILRSDNIPVILEVNTIPGFTPTSLLPKAAACSGISYEALCAQLVMMAWRDLPQVVPATECATGQGAPAKPSGGRGWSAKSFGGSNH